MEQQELSLIAGGRQNGPVTLEDNLAISYKTKHLLTIWSSKQDLWYLLKEFKTYVHTITCTQTFIAALFLIAKTWNHEDSVGEWINKLWSIQTMEYYPALKRNELSSREKTWRELKCIWRSERSQPEKPTYCMIPTLWHSGKGKTMETVKRVVTVSSWAQRGGMNRWSTEDF